MTPGEVIREVRSKQKRMKLQQQEKASYDYILASLIGKYVSVVVSGKGEVPSIEQAYDGLFDDVVKQQQEIRAQKKAEKSALNFRKFAQSYNKRLKNKEVQKPIDE